MANSELLTRLEIAELVQSWALYRDSGDWEKLKTTAHPHALITTTWYEGPFEGFIEAIQAAWRKGSRSQHVQGGTTVNVHHQKAIAQTRMSILVRGTLDDELVDVTCVGRFYDRVEYIANEWRIVKRSVIYEKDRMDWVNPTANKLLDRSLLETFPSSYCHLAYLQTKSGGIVNPNLPTSKGEALDHLIKESQVWLSQITGGE